MVVRSFPDSVVEELHVQLGRDSASVLLRESVESTGVQLIVVGDNVLHRCSIELNRHSSVFEVVAVKNVVQLGGNYCDSGGRIRGNGERVRQIDLLAGPALYGPPLPHAVAGNDGR